MTEAKAFRTFIRICSLLTSEGLSANIKLTLHKALIRPVITYACLAWELVAHTYLLQLQLLQKKVLRTTGNILRCASAHHWKLFNMRIDPRFVHGFHLLYVHDYIIKLCRQQAEVTKNLENEHVSRIGQGEAKLKI
jgi:hypothetical protein